MTMTSRQKSVQLCIKDKWKFIDKPPNREHSFHFKSKNGKGVRSLEIPSAATSTVGKMALPSVCACLTSGSKDTHSLFQLPASVY
jgi:hypothetical protein